MNSLDRKLLRDLWAIRGQALAIGLVISAGVAMFVLAQCAINSLTDSQQAYYDRYRFADVFSYAKRAPRNLVPQFEQIQGVSRVQARIVLDVTLDVPEMSEPAKGRLISIPDVGEPKLNYMYLRRGRWIEPRADGEVMVSESFANAHGFNPGDTVTATINGRYQELRIVGIALSPEFIIQVPPGNLLPDDRQFGIFWMSEFQLESAYDMKGAFNSVALKLSRGANEPEVISQIDRILEPFGSLGAYGRESHQSHQFISDEIGQLRSMSVVLPTLFLGVAGFLLNIVITRMIGLQREQIAALKAFGYTNVQVGIHYLKFVLSIAILGTVLGAGCGVWLAKGLVTMYAEFFKFPIFYFQVPPTTIIWAFGISCGVSVAGTLATLRRAVKLPPAEAMRPEPPAKFRRTLVERLGIGFLFSQVLRMIIRKLERQPVKAVLSIFGISMAVAVLILGSFSLDAVTYVIDFQFRVAQRQDMTITFFEPTHRSALHDVDHLPGVTQSEPFRAVATRFRKGYRSRRVGIMGLSPTSELYRIYDTDEERVTIPSEGVMLSDKLANLLDVSRGDVIDIEVMEGKQGTYPVTVAAVIQEFSGTNAYMSLNAVNRLLQEDALVSGAFVKTDPLLNDSIYQTLKSTPRVAGVTIKSAALQSFEDTIAKNILMMRAFNVFFAAIIAFGVVYNSARISLSEQSRELATLRVVGFTRFEVSGILLGELAIMTVCAIPFGCLFGYLFAALAIQGMDTEVFRLPLIVNQSTFAFAVVTVVIASVVSGLIVRRQIDRLDLVSVLKAKG